MRKTHTLSLTAGAMIAALYVVLTLLCSALGLASGAVQLRLSEALNALCLFHPAAIGGLTVGCLLSNLLSGCALWDVAVGSLATLLGAWGVYRLRRRPILALLAPVVTNALLLPPVFCFVYQWEGGLAWFALTVGAGQLLSATLAGTLLYRLLLRHLPQKKK